MIQVVTITYDQNYKKFKILRHRKFSFYYYSKVKVEHCTIKKIYTLFKQVQL